MSKVFTEQTCTVSYYFMCSYQAMTDRLIPFSHESSPDSSLEVVIIIHSPPVTFCKPKQTNKWTILQVFLLYCRRISKYLRRNSCLHSGKMNTGGETVSRHHLHLDTKWKLSVWSNIWLDWTCYGMAVCEITTLIKNQILQWNICEKWNLWNKQQS